MSNDDLRALARHDQGLDPCVVTRQGTPVRFPATVLLAPPSIPCVPWPAFGRSQPAVWYVWSPGTDVVARKSDA